MTITGGHTPSGAPGENVTGQPNSHGGEGENAEAGGGILNKGTLMLIESTVIGNTTGEGGAGGSGTGNPGGNGVGGVGGSGGAGGGIDSEGPLTIIDSLITDNSTGPGGVGGAGDGSPGGGGGAGGYGIGGNGGYGGDGGGVASGGPLIISDSTIGANTTGAGARGGGGFGADGETGTGGYGGFGSGGIGGGGGAGGGVYTNATTTITETEISGNGTGVGGFGGIGTGGYGGSGAGSGTGGEGGEGDGGFGGEGGSGAGISGGLEMAGEISRSAIVNNVTGAGGAGNAGVGRAGGAGGGPTGNGGAGGRADGGIGGEGGIGAGADLGDGTFAVRDTTLALKASGPGASGGDGGSGGLGQGGGTTGNGGNAFSGDGGSGGSAAGVFVGYQVTAPLTQDTISGNRLGAGAPAGANAIPGNPGGTAKAGEAGGPGVAAAVFAMTRAKATLSDSLSTWSSGEGCYGPVIDGGRNMSFPDATCPGTVVDPQLAPLQNNGGPTLTEAIAAGSPAVDAVPASGAGCEPTDQRGVLRPAGLACDIGAFELATATATTLEASGLTTASARLVGIARNPDLAGATAFFQYGTSTGYGKQTGEQPIEATAAGGSFSATLSGLAPHTIYHFRAVVTNATGVSFGADQTFTTAAQPSAGHTTITTGPPSHSLPLLTPLLRGLSIRPATLVPERGRGQSVTRANTKRGATVTYSDAQTAVSTFTVQRAQIGFLVGKTCAAKRPRHARGRVRRCTRYVAVGKFTHNDVAGANSFRFTGRVNARPLARGRYRLSAAPRAGSLTPANP